jgi:hypothetical protein
MISSACWIGGYKNDALEKPHASIVDEELSVTASSIRQALFSWSIFTHELHVNTADRFSATLPEVATAVAYRIRYLNGQVARLAVPNPN